jgi:Spy/CpxP family protein refolding chaperone
MKLINKQTVIAAFVGGLAALALTASGIALAHGGPHGGPHAKHGPWTDEQMDAFLEEMTERLDLSSEQQVEIQTIADGAKSRAAEIREMPRGKDKFLAFRDLHFATEDQIYENLTCEQREELRLLKREHRVERMQEHFEQRHRSSGN